VWFVDIAGSAEVAAASNDVVWRVLLDAFYACKSAL
jgi:hypothetical protein